jgi:hypothetical protein
MSWRPERAALALALALVGWCAVARAEPARTVSPRELEAREAFVTGEYQRALSLFGKLYAETLHPTYLRNIGRCYQNLGEPDRAITTFRDYLRKAGPLPAAERAEIDGYIAEMEALKQRRAPAPARPAPMTVAAAPPPAPAPDRAGGRRWWLWGALGAVAVGVAAVAAAVALSGRTDAPCPSGITCLRP